MRAKVWLFWASATLLVSAGCGHSPSMAAGPSPSPDAVRTELADATRHYARLVQSAPLDSVVAMYTPAGELDIPGQAPLRGRDQIRRFLAPIAAAATVPVVEMAIDSMVIEGEHATSAGTYRQVAGRKGAPADELQEYRGRYHVQWLREHNGAWKILRFVMHPSSAP